MGVGVEVYYTSINELEIVKKELRDYKGKS